MPQEARPRPGFARTPALTDWVIAQGPGYRLNPYPGRPGAEHDGTAAEARPLGAMKRVAGPRLISAHLAERDKAPPLGGAVAGIRLWNGRGFVLLLVSGLCPRSRRSKP
jgi:hypothetical protein